jgi:hypothetical protein
MIKRVVLDTAVAVAALRTRVRETRNSGKWQIGGLSRWRLRRSFWNMRM